jgi:hypothetical protein
LSALFRTGAEIPRYFAVKRSVIAWRPLELPVRKIAGRRAPLGRHRVVANRYAALTAGRRLYRARAFRQKLSEFDNSD